jgi:hypothetical protein
MGVPKFERFFRAAAGLDVDKSDLRRYDDFIHMTLADLLLMGVATAKANDRGIVDPMDLPITKGLQENIHQFEKLDHEIELEPILARLATHPALDLLIAEATEAELPRIAGGLSMALARSFKIIDPTLSNPSSVHWERAFRLFGLLL